MFPLPNCLTNLGRQASLDGVHPEIASDVDLQRGVIVLSGPELSDEALRDLQSTAAVPVEYKPAPRRSLQHSYGGRRLTNQDDALRCTTGFTVEKDLAGEEGFTRGIITAGHCIDNPRYHELDTLDTIYTLLRQGDWKTAQRDVQFNYKTSHVAPDDFWDGIAIRDLGAQVTRVNSQGDFVCHWGERTGRSCGNVVSINFDPGDLCGDLQTDPCQNVWSKVTGPDLACWGGDSGGPWFSGIAAYGIHTGGEASGTAQGQCTLAWFMSRDWLGGVGLFLVFS